MNNFFISELMPSGLKLTRSLDQFWQFIRSKYSIYSERREWIWGEFSPLLNRLEEQKIVPSHTGISDDLLRFDQYGVSKEWEKAF